MSGHAARHSAAANGRRRFTHRGRGDGAVMFLSQVLEVPGGQCQVGRVREPYGGSPFRGTARRRVGQRCVSDSLVE